MLPRKDDDIIDFLEKITNNNFNVPKNYTKMMSGRMRDMGDKYQATIEVPGFSEDEIDVKISKEKGLLEVTASKDNEDTGNDYERMMRKRVEKRISVPEDADESEHSVDYNNGILFISLAKEETEEEDGFINIDIE